ncbi:MAG TPA: radical SAM protein, partial [Geobacterales bacterium]|nr:radical SAM protein [Geobacterales bacterium]
MRLLLVNANRFKQPWPVIPFGLCCVAAAVESAGHQVTILDLCFSPDPAAQLQEAITTFLPDVIGVGIRNIDNGTGCNTRFLLDDTLREVISPIKRHFSGPIVIGGAAVGISGREMLHFFDLPYALTGDGEEGMVLFLRQLAEGRTPSGIGGLIVRRNGTIVEENEPLRVGNLDRLLPAKPQRYLDLAPYRRFGSSLQIQTKRGCALRCSYCTYRRIEGESYRLRNPEQLAHEVATLVAETGISQIEIVDSTFNLPLDHCKEVLRALIALNVSLQLKAMGLSPAAVDEELVTLLKTAGFREVGLGVESASPVTLRSLGKGFGRKEILRAGELLHQGGIPVSWYLLVGAPGETRQTLADTFDTISAAA